MRHWAFVAIAVATVAVPGPSLALTWQDIHNQCRKSEVACREAIIHIAITAYHDHPGRICIPPKTGRAVIVAAITGIAEMVPHEWPTIDAYKLVYSALAVNYPCPTIVWPVNPI